jgi:vancomycin resistance protein YoaR
MNWAASHAGLEVTAKVDHNFMTIFGVPKEYGTSIRYAKLADNSQNQNLYIRNNFDRPVEFKFKVNNDAVELEIAKLTS